jgi:hypothetical protein
MARLVQAGRAVKEGEETVNLKHVLLLFAAVIVAVVFTLLAARGGI